MNASEEVPRSFFVSGCDAPKVLDVIEEPLDEIALGVKCVVAYPLNLAV